MKLNDKETQMVSLYKRLTQSIICAQPMHPTGFNHGFLWAHIEFNRRQKNGKVKTFRIKTLLTGCTCPNDWAAVQRDVEALPGVVHTHVNMD